MRTRALGLGATLADDGRCCPSNSWCCQDGLVQIMGMPLVVEKAAGWCKRCHCAVEPFALTCCFSIASATACPMSIASQYASTLTCCFLHQQYGHWYWHYCCSLWGAKRSTVSYNTALLRRLIGQYHLQFVPYQTSTIRHT